MAAASGDELKAEAHHTANVKTAAIIFAGAVLIAPVVVAAVLMTPRAQGGNAAIANGLAAGAVGPSWVATERERNAATTQALQEQLQQTEQMQQQQLFQQREDYLLRNAINPPRPPDFR